MPLSRSAFRVLNRAAAVTAALVLASVAPLLARAEAPVDATGQTWVLETLDNGLRVIYAPMPSSPTTHVRVMYHVGSRDEQSNRQGFAHMFEHMMFRGSAHVTPQEHMKLIGLVGGYSNAFTSFDETVYVNTIPATYTQLALWLEADRMSSFKVSPEIFYTERLVVGEEWRMRMNQPYGTMWDELFAAEFKMHPYHWTPIGNMQHLQAARAPELQTFFNHYYVPNNAILVVAGNIDVEKTKQMVHQYYGWIPGTHAPSADGGKAASVERNITPEPQQTEPRRVELPMRVPLTRVVLAYHAPVEASDDLEPLGLLISILGDGRSSRLYKALVTTNDPSCTSADAYLESLEDGGMMGAMATLLKGKDVAAVEKIVRDQIAQIRDNPVTAEELEKVKQQQRLGLATRFETAESVATVLGDEMLIRNNLDRITTARQRLEAITAADLQRVAKKYFADEGATTLIIKPGTPATAASAPAAATRAADASSPAGEATTQPQTAAVKFPADYPTTAPMSGKLPAATFEKGVETTITMPNSTAPVHVIVMENHRIPLINWSLTMRAGGYAEPKGKEGLASLTAQMVRRGPKGKTYDQFNDELELRAISVEAGDGGDITRIGGSSLKEQFPFAINAAKAMALTPAFDAGEFDRLKAQVIDNLRLTLTTPSAVAGRQLTKAIYGGSPLGRLTTPESVAGITLEDVKAYYQRIYHVDDAILMISGDITVEEGQKAAANFLAGFSTGALPKVDYALPAAATSRHVYLVDLGSSRQSSIRMGIPAYSIASDEKFAGSLSGQMLSSGIDSRLGRYVRAEKGYVYGVSGVFSPGRQAGTFNGSTDTKFETTTPTIEAMFKVFDDMKAAAVPEKELADAKFRVAGQLLMAMETISAQAQRRVDAMLNGYPIDYYDKYAERIGQVTAEQVQGVMNKYVDDKKMTIVVVAPAEKVKEQLDKLGTVEVIKGDVE